MGKITHGRQTGTAGLGPIRGPNGVHKPNTAKAPTSAPGKMPHVAKAEMPNSGKIALSNLSCSEGGKSC